MKLIACGMSCLENKYTDKKENDYIFLLNYKTTIVWESAKWNHADILENNKHKVYWNFKGNLLKNFVANS
jgi:hypothetical protein